jgi:hypothetical protein
LSYCGMGFTCLKERAAACREGAEL